MKYLFKFLMLVFSFGILLYPAQNNISQNLKSQSCCSTKDSCNKEMPEKTHKNSQSRDCCNVTVSVCQFFKTEENFSAKTPKNGNFTLKSTFFYKTTILPNTLLAGPFQPPKFI